MPTTELQSPNFDFLREHDPLLLEYAARAERYVLDDPNTCLIKLRQLAEGLAENAAAYNGIRIEYHDDFTDILRNLERRDIITREMAGIFHDIRKAGNAAAHEGAGTRQEAVAQLKLARRLAVWFHQAFRDPRYRPAPFALPAAKPEVSPSLKAELEKLRKARWDAEREADETEEALKKAEREREAAEARAAAMYSELEAALTLAEETEARQESLALDHADIVTRLKADAEAASDAELAARNEQAKEAAAQFDLSEGEARERIDAALRARGWEADSVVRTWQNGARPQPGRNMAIAFVPTAAGYADYVLYRGLHATGIIEAKRRNVDLRDALREAGVHGRAYRPLEDELLGEGAGEYRVPLLFASNGRPFGGLEDVLHGVWCMDMRSDADGAHVLKDWPAPEELH